MCPGFDRAFAAVFDFAAPEKNLALFVGGLQFEPHIESIHSAAGEEVADLARADHNVYQVIVATANGSLDSSKWRSDFAGLALYPLRSCSFRFFANGEGSGKFWATGKRRW